MFPPKPPLIHLPDLPRRPTRGILDINDSPLTSPLSSTTNLITTSLLSPVVTANPNRPLTPRTPRLPSPSPGSNLTFKTAPSTLSSASPSFKSASSTLLRDFTYLLRPEIYHPLPLLEIPPPFRTPSPASSTPTPSLSSLQSLLLTGHFRTAAHLSSTLLVSLPPSTPASLIFSLFYVRLASLTLCNQTSLAAQEVKALEDLNAAYYRDPETGDHMVGWELRVLAVRLQGMGFNDARRGVMGYYDLGRDARSTLSFLKKRLATANEGEKEGTEAEIRLWTERLEDLGIRVASALIEMEDLPGAILHLSSLPSTPEISLKKALLYLHLGDVDAARSTLSSSPTAEGENKEKEQTLQALLHMTDNNYDAAATTWDALISTCPNSSQIALWRQNLAVTLLYLGRGDEARDILESLLRASPSNRTPQNNTFHALTFNLSTIYELCTERSRALKIGLAERVAGMSASAAAKGGEIGEAQGETQVLVGWEKVNGDFKL